MSKAIKGKVIEYTVIFETAEEGGYVVSVPAIPGCRTQGETFEEASINIKEAIVGCLEVLKKEGEDIPVENKETITTKVSVTNPAFA